jgi:acyl carrier protein
MSKYPDVDELRRFILVELLKTPNATLADEDDLLLSGLLDSLNVMRLVAYIEEQSGTSIPPEDLLPEHFETLSCILSYLQSKDNPSACPIL